MNDELDIIIPCYEGSEKLSTTLASIVKNTIGNYNLITVVRDADVAPNRNHGLLMARGGLCCMMDDDVEVPPGWNTMLIETLRTFKLGGAKVGMVGPRVEGTNGERQNDSFDVGKDEQKVCYTCGALFIYDRAELPDLMADTNYIGSQVEDLDLTSQMQAKGYLPVVDGRVTIKHHNDMKNNTSKTWEQNHGYYGRKWAGWNEYFSDKKES